MKKLSLLVFSLSLILANVVGLTPLESAQAQDLEEINLMLDWYPNANHIPIYMALEKGYFEDEGLKVNIQMPAETDDPIRLVAANQTDIGISYPSVLTKARAEDLSVKTFGSLVQQRMDCIMFKKDSGIKTAKDLEGKNVGFASDPISESNTFAMVEADGGDPNKVTMTDVGWDLMPALATDKVDAIIGAYVNHEYLMLQDQGYDMDLLKFEDFGIPESQELIFIASEDTLNNRSDSLKKFMTALEKGYQTAKESPEEALDILFSKEENAYTLDKKIEEQSWNMLLDFMVKDGSFGSVSGEQYEAYAQWLYDVGAISKEVKADDLVAPLN